MTSLIDKFRAFFASKPSREFVYPKSEKEWTFLIYLAGDNNLEDAGIDDIDEAEQAGGSTDQTNVVVQFDRIRGYDSTNEDWITTKRFYITKGDKVHEIESIEVGDLGETNCGDPNVLEDFLIWGIEKFPAKHYAVVIWNHGLGWDDTDLYRLVLDRVRHFKPTHKKMSRKRIIDFRTDRVSRALFEKSVLGSLTMVARGIAYDDSNQDFLDNKELENVLSRVYKKTNKRIDILGMDACLMAMAEVAYQNKDYVNYFVASEEVEPWDGWPYELIIKELNDKPELTPKDLSQIIVKRYMESYDNEEWLTLSSVKTEILEDLAKAVSDLAVSLTKNISSYTEQLGHVLGEVICYDVWEYVDLKDFARLVKEYIPNEASKAEAVIILLDKAVVEAGGYGAGLSIYLPFDYNDLYNNLNWAKVTKWDEFIKAYIEYGIASKRLEGYSKRKKKGKRLIN